MSTVNQTLKTVRTPLLELHRILLLILKKDLERTSGRVIPPAEWFQVLLSAPEYQWVKPLNTLVSDMDALSELAKIRDEDLSILHHQVNSLLFSDNQDVTSFNSHYRKLFADNHELVFVHGQMKEAASVLPLEQLPMNAEEIRLGWHKVGSSKRKLLN